MRDQVKTERLKLVKALFSKTKPQLVESVLSELEAKNRAYEFILSKGMLNEFKEF